jgi:Mn2+/Fe2+ NRAMP family transporter
MDIRPLPAIILAQALNGFILPFISIFLFLALNRQYKKQYGRLNGWFNNLLLLLIILVCLMLSIYSLFDVATRISGSF